MLFRFCIPTAVYYLPDIITYYTVRVMHIMVNTITVFD